MKRTYVKAALTLTEGMPEGVYMASGSIESPDNSGQPACQSKYMKGMWQKPSSGATQAPVKERRGCEGCSADDGDGCKILKGGELNANGVFKPTWEQMGMSPDTLVW